MLMLYAMQWFPEKVFKKMDEFQTSTKAEGA